MRRVIATLFSALVVVAPFAVSQIDVAPVGAIALTCAQGGTCAVGDTGPGGGTVFFVKPASGGFSASLSIPDTSSMCQMMHMCQDVNVNVALTSAEVAALPFDYLEVAPQSAEATTAWAATNCGVGNNCGADGTKIGTGQANTDAVIAARPNDTTTQNASKYADQLVSGGKSDWYLPSFDELNLIFLRWHATSGFAGFQSGDYYQSSTNTCSCARWVRFDQYHAGYITIDTSITAQTRPIRSIVLASGTTTTSTTTTTTTTSTTSTTVAPTSTTTAPTTTTTVAGNASGAGVTTTSSTSTTVAGGQVSGSTTTSSTSTSSTTTVPVAPDAPDAAPGEAAAIVDGEPLATTLERSDNSLIVSGAGIAATVYGESKDGVRIDLDAEGNLNLTGEDSVVVEAKGYDAGEEIAVWLHSTPVRLGVLTAGADGSIKGTFALPDGAEKGDHRLVLQGKSATGQDVVIGIGLTVGNVDGTSGLTRALIVVPVALAVLLGLMIPTTMRRRRKNEQIA